VFVNEPVPVKAIFPVVVNPPLLTVTELATTEPLVAVKLPFVRVILPFVDV